MQGEQPVTSYITPVQQHQIAPGEVQAPGYLQFMDVAGSNLQVLGCAHRVQEDVKFDGVFAGLEIGPGKKTGADRHVGGIQDLHPPGLGPAAGFGLKARQELLVSLLKDQGGALLVGVGQGGTLGGGKAQVVELLPMAVQAKDQVPQALFGAQLGVEHGHQL